MSIALVIGVGVAVLAVAVTLAVLRIRALNRPQAPLPVGATDGVEVSEADLLRARELLAAGKRMEAVKELCAGGKVGLKQARQIVDAVQAGVPVGAPTGTPAPEGRAGGRNRAAVDGEPTPDRGGTLSPQVRRAARRLMDEGHRLQAIKLIQARSGMDLAGSKRAADALRDTAEGAQAPAETGDLADRTRALLRDGRHGAAVELVCALTGMTLVEAARFVQSLDG